MNINDELIQKIIDDRSIYVDFQPIYSFNTKKVIGLEALSRGQLENELVSPYFLFNYAKKHGETLQLDRICREKAIESFPKENDTSSLFINFETSSKTLTKQAPTITRKPTLVHARKVSP